VEQKKTQKKGGQIFSLHPDQEGVMKQHNTVMTNWENSFTDTIGVNVYDYFICPE
jgi:hypothetical protein